MNLFNSLLFYLFILCIKSGYSKTYTCWNKNVPLKYGEIAFFQLGNYPTLSPIKNLKLCTLNFILDEKSVDNFRLVYHFVELYHAKEYNYHSKDEIVYNQSSFSPFIPYMPRASSITQQGYAIFEKISDQNSCPLSKEGIYELEDKTQIVTLTNFFIQDKVGNTVTECNWKFKGPEGYGFKIWVNELNFDHFSSGVELIVKNSTSVFFNHRTLDSKTKSLHPVYNSDNFIDIRFTSKNELTRLNISLSLVKNTRTKYYQNCYLTKIKNVTYSSHIWGISYNKGYKNNGYCYYQFILPSNSLLYAQHGKLLLLDTFGDGIKVRIGENEERDVTNNGQNFFDLGPFEKDTDITFIFTSDGSFQGLGFQVKIDIYECKCNSQYVPCNAPILHNYMENSETYCNNLACNFTFLPCETENSMVTFYETSTVFEVFKIYSDGIVVFDLKNYHEFISNFFTIIKSSANNTLEVIPLAHDNYINEQKNHPVGSQRRFVFNVFETPNEKPNVYVALSLNASTEIINMGLFKMVYFEVSKELMNQNLTFTISVSDLLFTDNTFILQVFDNENLTQNLLGKKCFDDSNPYICELKRDNFVIAQRFFPNYYSPFITVQLSKKFDSCIFEDTVFILKAYGPGAISKQLNISQIASSNGNCDITILVDLSYDDSVINDRHFYISSIFTTAKNENVKIFFGNKNQSNLFFEFNQATAHKWRYISLNSKGYTIEIPKSSSLLIIIEKSENYIPSENFPFSSFESLLTTPYYFGVKYEYYNHSVSSNTHIYYFWGTDSEREVTFQVIDFKVFEDEEIYFLIDDIQKLRVVSPDEKMTFKKNGKNKNIIGFKDNIKLIYHFPKHQRPPRIENGALFYIQYSSE